MPQKKTLNQLLNIELNWFHMKIEKKRFFKDFANIISNISLKF